MGKPEVAERLDRLGQAEREWSKTHSMFKSDADVILSRLLHEAAAAKMSVDDVASALGWTTSRVRTAMRKHGLNPRRGRNILAAQAAETLATNATIMGLDPDEVDYMSPLRYLPMGDALKREFLETPPGFKCGTCGTSDPDGHLFYCGDPSRDLDSLDLLDSTEEPDDL